jgi:hypothetical protein
MPDKSQPSRGLCLFIVVAQTLDGLEAGLDEVLAQEEGV